MAAEEKLRAYRKGIDEAKQFISKYGLLPALLYSINLPKGSDEAVLWAMAIAEWSAEHKGQWSS